MTYGLDEFCADVREILRVDDNHSGRDRVRMKLEQLLGEREFCQAYVGDDCEPGLQQIFEDEETGFCVLAYNMEAPRTSPPHDHGGSWAVYGQVEGHTDMTIWDSPDGSETIEPVREFRLNGGQAGLFDVREIHSINYTEGARFVRVTGKDMAEETRRVFDPETGTVREIEHVGTGSA